MTNDEMSPSMPNYAVAQWITSLAISVICCAILFIVFAGYIVRLHDTTNLLSLKVELLKERNDNMAYEISMLRKGPVVQINGVAPGMLSITQPEGNASSNEAPAAGQTPAAAPAAPATVAPAAPQEKMDIVIPVEEPAPADVIVPSEPAKKTIPPKVKP
ncbi:MAG: hypothetical protein WC612_03525 [Bdellovibrionales bacterium]|jgi:hypothetical protein